MVAADAAKSFDATQSANAVAIKVVTGITCIKRGREQFMFTINNNHAPRDADHAGGCVNRVNGVGQWFKQLNRARGCLRTFRHRCRSCALSFHIIVAGCDTAARRDSRAREPSYRLPLMKKHGVPLTPARTPLLKSSLIRPAYAPEITS